MSRAQWDDWKAWGERFGWKLNGITDVVTGYTDAEFEVPNPDETQGHEYIGITTKVRKDIDRAIENAVDLAKPSRDSNERRRGD